MYAVSLMIAIKVLIFGPSYSFQLSDCFQMTLEKALANINLMYWFFEVKQWE